LTSFKIGFFLSWVICYAFVFEAHAQSSNCQNARLPDEALICQDEQLGNLDRDMADIVSRYRALLKGEELQSFLYDQTLWLVSRMACKSDASCIYNKYKLRLSSLRSHPPDLCRGPILAQPKECNAEQQIKNEMGQSGSEIRTSVPNEADLHALGSDSHPQSHQITSSITSDGEAPYELAISDCSKGLPDNAHKGPEFMACMQVRIQIEEVTLAEIYKSTYEKFKKVPSRIFRLKTSERAWMQFRNANCAFARAIAGLYRGPEVFYACIMRITVDRQAELQRLADNQARLARR
jgi:uncharacterized protein